MQTDPQRLVAHLHTYQEAINRADADAAATLFLDTARIEEEGVSYLGVRAVLDYLIGECAHIELSDFRIQGQQVTCTYHEVSELDRVVGYAGSRRQADFTFSQDQRTCLARAGSYAFSGNCARGRWAFARCRPYAIRCHPAC